MNSWEKQIARIIEAVINVEANTTREKIIKIAILVYLQKSLASEEIFNDNCETLNNYEKVKKI